MCDQQQAIEILGEVYTACSQILRNSINDAYLYGSYARGDYHAESDIDILLTVDLEAEAISECRRSLAFVVSDLCLAYDITVSVVVKPLAQFKQYAEILPYYKNVLKEGIRYQPEQ